MIITYNEEFVNNKLIEKGYGTKGVHSFIFDRYFTDEEKEESSNFKKVCNINEWSDRCEEIGRNLNIELEKIMQILNKEFAIYQYEDNEVKFGEQDLFFYSNRGWNKKDYYDYMTLTFNTKNSEERNEEIYNKLHEILNNLSPKNIECRIQYTTLKDDEKIKTRVVEICKEIEGKMIVHCGMAGKIKCFNSENDRYIFMKKGARKNGYEINCEELVLNY